MRRNRSGPNRTLRKLLLLVSVRFGTSGRAPCPVPAGPAAARPAGWSCCSVWLVCTPSISGQTPAPVMERVTLDEAVARALARNPTVCAQAATAIVRAEGFLQQARAATRPSVSAGLSTSVLDSGRAFDDLVVQPRTQTLLSANASVPLLAASQWAAATQARDQIDIARLSVTDVRKEIASATAQAYLGIIAAQRQIEVNLLARARPRRHTWNTPRNGWRAEPGRASMSCGRRRKSPAMKRGWRLRGWPRGERREALGVLLAADGPVDAAAEPLFEDRRPSLTSPPGWRPGRTSSSSPPASEQRNGPRADSFKDYFPTVFASLRSSGRLAQRSLSTLANLALDVLCIPVDFRWRTPKGAWRGSAKPPRQHRGSS